jgi:hypothetical protein
MTVRVIPGARALVAGLVWQTLSGAQKPAAQATAIARSLKAQRLWAPSGARTAGFVPREDAAGVKLPAKCWPAAAMFASLPSLPRSAVLALELPTAPDGRPEAALIAVHDGQPLPDYDLVLPTDEVGARGEQAIESLERLLGDRPLAYGGLLLGGEPITWSEIAEQGIAAPLARPSVDKLLPLAALLVVLGLAGYQGWQWWKVEQRKRAAAEAAAQRIDPNVAYSQSVAAALGAQRWIGPQQLAALVGGMARVPLALGGFQLDRKAGIECGSDFNCSATYRRGVGTAGTYSDFATALPKGLFQDVQYAIDGQSVAVKFAADKPTSAAPPVAEALWAEADLPRKAWPLFQRLETLPAQFTLRQGATVIGTVPPGATESEIAQLVRTWPLEGVLPAWGPDALPPVPGLTLDKVTLKFGEGARVHFTGRIHAIRKN